MRLGRPPLKVLRLGLLLALPMAILAGCANNPDGRVIAMPNRQVAGLDADDVVRVMQRAGFSDEQILELGTELRNGLASSGAAQIRVGDKVESIFAVDGRYLHVSSRRRGSFIYDLKTGRVR